MQVAILTKSLFQLIKFVMVIFPRSSVRSVSFWGLFYFLQIVQADFTFKSSNSFYGMMILLVGMLGVSWVMMSWSRTGSWDGRKSEEE